MSIQKFKKLKNTLREFKPNFNDLVKAVENDKEPNRVHQFEILIDEEIKKYILENFWGEKNYPPVTYERKFRNYDELYTNLDCVLNEIYSGDNKEKWKKYYESLTSFYCKMGYSTVPFFEEISFFQRVFFMRVEQLLTADSANLSRGERWWAQEGKGLIRSLEDFEKFPWGKAKRSLMLKCEEHLDFIEKVLPEGMKIVIEASLFEQIMEHVFGYEGLFYTINDDPNLIDLVFERFGEIIYEFYFEFAQMDSVGCIMQADDLGFKTATFLSRDHLKRWVFPWLKKYSSIAHKNGKGFWHHCCGYKEEIMEDLINDIKLDVIHSFEDSCCNVIEYKEKYGKRVAIAGGVDVDKLARLDENNLRAYIKKILDKCMLGGRYLLGSGNSITNYVPIENYLILLEEGLNWKN